MKAVTDMITGMRTIKCYAWENHYIKKINKIRSDQKRVLYWTNVYMGIGQNVYNNFGLIAILVIFLPKWYNNEKIDQGEAFSLLAMVFVLFYAINGMAYWSLSTL
mmetsp:Transcript_40800/g.29425  ORF Transcript_40800/g.29425 Transcript_40800/m.29425 type:complete len:105 (+) Transcript_40800:991-1305(+)